MSFVEILCDFPRIEKLIRRFATTRDNFSLTSFVSIYVFLPHCVLFLF